MAFPLHPIHRAIYEQKINFDHIQALISSDCSSLAAVNTQNGYSPLHAAARRGDVKLMRLLVQAGGFVDARAKNGQTPFLIACQIGNVRNVHVLAEAGADTRIADQDGKCAMHYAALVGSIPVMHYLVQILKHDPNGTDNMGNTALHYAVEERITLSVAYLLKHRYCLVDQANKAGLTSLHIAAKNGSPKMIWELMINSKDTQVLHQRDANGCIPEELAKQGKRNSHKTATQHLSRWRNSAASMRRVPWIYWCIFIVMPGVFMIIADLAFCYLKNPTMALIIGALVGAAGFYFPVRPHRIPHESGWHNPAFMGAMLTEVAHTSLCFCLRIFPILWPESLFLLCCLVINSLFGLYIFLKFKTTDPGFDRVGKLSSNGKPLTILDVVNQEHNLSYFELEKEYVTGSSVVLQFCDFCEIVIPHRTKHCKLCNGCCNGFDHHCLWLTSCVGLNNHRLFVLFNIALTIEGVIYLWGAIAALSVVMGSEFPWNLFHAEAFLIEKWIKFRFLVTLCTVIYTSKILLEQFTNISRLETTYFDLSGMAAYGKSRSKSNFSWRMRLKLIVLFFTDYNKWFAMSNSSSTISSTHGQV